MDPSHHLRAFLADTDTPCPACSYNLRGLQTPACPECNQLLTLRVSLAEPRLGRFLAALVGLALGAGFHGLLLLYFIFIAILEEVSGREQVIKFLLLTAPSALLEGTLLFLLIRCRGRFQRSTSTTQFRIIAGAWLLTLITFILFARFIR